MINANPQGEVTRGDSGNTQRELNKMEQEVIAGKRNGLSGHQSPCMNTDEWVTPRYLVKPLGPFDLDPCSFHERPWQIAGRYYTVQENGLDQEWSGRVWLNPPFGQKAAEWLQRMARHGNGIALIPARTETKMFFESVWNEAWGILFVKGRPHFCYKDGKMAPFNSGAPIALIAYSPADAEILRREAFCLGKFVAL